MIRIRRPAVTIPALLLLLPPSTSAQETGAGAWVSASVELTSVHGEATALPGFGIGVEIAPGVRLGGGGHLLATERAIGSDGFRDLAVEFGYGGVVVEVERPVRNVPLHAGLMVGAGNVDVVDRVTAVRLDSENLVVLRPHLGVGFEGPGPGRIQLALSYRWTSAVSDLPRVGGEDLRGAGATVVYRLGT